MSGKAVRIVLSEKQLKLLQQMIRSTTLSQRLVQRASVILLAFEGHLNQDIATRVNLGRKQVGRWRRRWQESFDALVSIEGRETGAALRRAIEDVLSDAPRSGCYGKFSAEQITQIMALACELPEQSGRSVDHWTHAELADEAAKQHHSQRGGYNQAHYHDENASVTHLLTGSATGVVPAFATASQLF